MKAFLEALKEPFDRAARIRHLLELDHNPYASDEENCTFLHVAVEKGWLDVVEELLEREIEDRPCNRPHRTAFEIAVFKKQQDIVNAFTSRHVYPKKDSDYAKALIIRIIKNAQPDEMYYEVLKLLLEKGTKIDPHWTPWLVQHPDIQLGRLLLRYYPSIYSDALLEADKHEEPSVFKSILEMKDVEDKSYIFPSGEDLMISVNRNKRAVVKFVLRREKSMSMLMRMLVVACGGNYVDEVQFILDNEFKRMCLPQCQSRKIIVSSYTHTSFQTYNENIQQLLVRHFAKMSMIGHRLVDYLRITDEYAEDNANALAYYNRCVNELEEMKLNEVFTKEMDTFLDLLLKKDEFRSLERYKRYKKLIGCLRDFAWEEKFPIYGDQFVKFVRKLEKTKNLIDRARPCLGRVVGFDEESHYYILEGIMCYLDKNDLVTLITTTNQTC